MGIVSWLLFGLLAGVLAKVLLPGKDRGGLIMTTVIGIAGAFLGGYIGTRIGLGTVHDFDVRSVALAIGGAMILLLADRIVRNL